MSRKAPREWRVIQGDEERLGRSLIAVQAIGSFIGGTVEITSPKNADPFAVKSEDGAEGQLVPAWLFSWRDTSTDGEPLRPRWTVAIDDEEHLEESEVAVDLVTEFLGGVFQVGAIREERDGEWETVGRAFAWQSFVPALKSAPEEPAANGTPEPVAAA